MLGESPVQCCKKQHHAQNAALCDFASVMDVKQTKATKWPRPAASSRNGPAPARHSPAFHINLPLVFLDAFQHKGYSNYIVKSKGGIFWTCASPWEKWLKWPVFPNKCSSTMTTWTCSTAYDRRGKRLPLLHRRSAGATGHCSDAAGDGLFTEGDPPPHGAPQRSGRTGRPAHPTAAGAQRDPAPSNGRPPPDPQAGRMGTGAARPARQPFWEEKNGAISGVGTGEKSPSACWKWILL